MKKYLMIGFVAAVAFTSCSKNDFTPATQAEIDKAKYDQKFVETFGKPASNQDWGFGATTRAFTRSVDVNGNMWESRPEVTEKEANAIFEYVNRVKSSIPTGTYYEESPVNLQNFFVTQVSGGSADDDNCLYYPAGRQWGDKVHGASKMNHLQISKSATRVTDGTLPGGEAEWQHANNFNASQNRDWDGNTMFVDWGTQNFAYHSTEDSKYHDKWIIVDGQYITDVDGNHYPGKYYLCFDFIADAPVKTSFQYYVKNPYRDEWFSDNMTIDGEWDATTIRNSGISVTKTITHYDQEQQKEITETFTFEFSDTENVRFGDQFNVEGGNMNIEANDIYTDWIVRLVEAQPKNQITYDLRVMAEDLSVTSASDFDFNDVVFDAKIDATAGKTYIKLLAAGGTMPLRIGCDEEGNGGEEVHEKFGVTTSTMVNTAAGQHNAKTPVEFTLNQTWSSIGNIPVYVYKNGEWQPITAYTGMPASKFGCPVGTDWADERQDIDKKWDGNFTIWVGDVSKPFWADWNKQ